MVWRARLNVGSGGMVFPGGFWGVVDMFKRGAESPVGIRGGWLDMMLKQEAVAASGVVNGQRVRTLAHLLNVSSRITWDALGGYKECVLFSYSLGYRRSQRND